MAVERIKCFGLKLADGKLAIFKAGRLKYRAEEQKWQTELIDGERVEGAQWIHLTFDLLVMYLDQQLVGDDVPSQLKALEGNSLPYFTGGEVTLKYILDCIYNANTTAIYIYPMLLNEANTVRTNNHRVLGDSQTIDLINAQKNGRFEPFIPISLKTKSPTSGYPNWINR